MNRNLGTIFTVHVIKGSIDDMLWNDRGKVGNVSGKCEEDEGTDSKMNTVKNKVETVITIGKGSWSLNVLCVLTVWY
jgi:hypothetical protein